MNAQAMMNKIKAGQLDDAFRRVYVTDGEVAKLTRHESWTGASSVGFSVVRQETMYSSDNQKLLFPVT